MLACLAGTAFLPAQAQPSEETILRADRILVTGLRPFGGAAVPGVRILDADDAGSLPTMSDWLARAGVGITITEPQGNPFQPEVSYRGYSVSGLLGLPQGLALYQNGTRVNEAFGDAVNFEMIPEMAIDRIAVIEGADPLFGLNALGGAVAVEMKNGFSFPEAGAKAQTGSFGRWSAAAEAGWNNSEWSTYAALARFSENGWRDFSPSMISQAYGDIRQRRGPGEIGLSVSWAQSDLTGNGASPVILQERDRAAIFTHPDTSRNTILMVQADGDYLASDKLTLEGSAHYRYYRQNTVNGDESDAEACPDNLGFQIGFVCLAEDEEPARPLDRHGAFIPLSDVGDAPFGLLNRSATAADSYGTTIQASVVGVHRLLPELLIGALVESARASFENSAELGVLNPTRGVDGATIFLGGDDFNTGLNTTTTHWGAYAGAVLALGDRIRLDLSGRYGNSDIVLDDQLGSALDGTHAFSLFSPALSLIWDMPLAAGGTSHLRARFAQSSRTPSPAELSCADETRPCRFPNAFTADPPLKQVVVQNTELRWTGNMPLATAELSWSLAAFSSTNLDDIIFVSAGPRIGTGYFRNAGRTLRQGVEASIDWEAGPLSFALSYSFIDASFQDPLTIRAPANPEADDNGNIAVQPGDRIPLIPQHSGHIRADWQINSRFNAGFSVHGASDRFYRGDEGNATTPLPGFIRLDGKAAMRVSGNLSLFLLAENILGARYATFGAFGETGEVPLPEIPTPADDPRFTTPAAPVSVFIGLRASL